MAKDSASKDSLPKDSASKASEPKAAANIKEAPSTNDLQTKSSPTDIPEVIERLDQLIANTPKTTPLLTSQILNKAQR